MRTIAASAVLVLVVASTAQAQTNPAEMEKATISAIRGAGAAIMKALANQLPGNTVDPARQTTFSWSSCPSASYDRIVALVGPDEAAELPHNDGWGNPLEYCLKVDKTAPPAERFVVGIRSAGRDARFDISQYQHGPFSFEAFDSDIVWLNGFFFNWPQKEPSGARR